MFTKNNFLETNWFDAEIEHSAPKIANYVRPNESTFLLVGGGDKVDIWQTKVRRIKNSHSWT